MAKTTSPQNYPRINDEASKFNGHLDDAALKAHHQKIAPELLRKIILRAIESANLKSSRAILQIPEGLSEEETQRLYRKKGLELFKYFVKYCGDPAATAHQCLGQNYRDVAKEQFRKRTLQKERMNSGWRYQYIVKDAAIASQRFDSVSDIGAAEADFNATLAQIDPNKSLISIYISIKNRMNTLGGQDWPKAIRALEDVARTDKNRNGPYLCVFGIAMEHGSRIIRAEQKTGQPYSSNTEVWLSDFLWPFFANYSYSEIIQAVVAVLMDTQKPDVRNIEIPTELIDAFGQACQAARLLDAEGRFNNAYELANLFVKGVTGARSSRKK